MILTLRQTPIRQNYKALTSPKIHIDSIKSLGHYLCRHRYPEPSRADIPGGRPLRPPPRDPADAPWGDEGRGGRGGLLARLPLARPALLTLRTEAGPWTEEPLRLRAVTIASAPNRLAFSDNTSGIKVTSELNYMTNHLEVFPNALILYNNETQIVQYIIW